MGDSVEPRVCRLCGAPLLGAASERGQFCCIGCERVHEVLGRLDESAHATYLEAARRIGLIPAADGSRTAAASDERLPEDPSALCRRRFRLGGLMCPSCAWVAEQVLAADAGVLAAEVDYFSGLADLRFDLRRTSVDQLGQLLDGLGYRLEPADQERRALSRRSTLEFVVTAVITANIMMLASVRYFEGTEWLDEAPAFLVWIEALLLAPVLYLGWIPMLRRAASGIRSRQPTMDLLLSTAVAAAVVLSLAALFAGRSEIYFETCAGLVTISLLSRMIETRLRERAYSDLATLLDMPVVRVRRRGPGGEPDYAAIEDVGAGDLLVFRAGELVPFDGEVRGEAVLVSEAVLSGEPAPVAKPAGALVVAGSTVVEGRLELAVLRRFDETRLHQIERSVVETLRRAEQRLRSGDRISGVFVPAILAVALGAWVFRLVWFGLDHALSPDGWFPSVAVLAVACPCAFSLAGITAVTAATGSLLRRGFLVKEPGQLEELSRVGHVVFDKTGTVTEGRMVVERVVWRDAPSEGVLDRVATAERGSRHPVAQALRAHLAEAGFAPTGGGAAPVEDRPGLGRVMPVDGSEFAIGGAALFDDRFEPPGLTARHSVVWFGYDGRAVGCFLISDQPRDDAGPCVAALAGRGISAELVSGDRAAVTGRVAREIGLDDATGDASIEDKVALVERRRAAGKRVAYVGDGTNDALAMGAASVSVALAQSTDEALAASGFVALRGELEGLPDLFAVGRKLARVIRGNYIWAFGFNSLFIPVAAAGELVPLAAMLLMLASSTAVLLNSLRLRR